VGRSGPGRAPAAARAARRRSRGTAGARTQGGAGASRAAGGAGPVPRGARPSRGRDGRAQSGGAGGARLIPAGLDRGEPRHRARARGRLPRAPQCPGRAAGQSGPVPVHDRAARQTLGGSQLQGRPAARPAHRSTGAHRLGSLRRRGGVSRPDRRRRSRHGRRILAPARAERLRQLDQGRAARARAYRARSGRAGKASAANRPVHHRERGHEGPERCLAGRSAGHARNRQHRDLRRRSSGRRAVGRRGDPRRAPAPPMSEAAAPRPIELPLLRGAELLLVTIAISLATFMEVLDITIVNVSVPSIAGTLGVSPNEGTWTITSYSMAAAIMQPLTGWLGRRFGGVRTFAVSRLLFVLLSALCGLSTSLPMLGFFRLMQGAVSRPMAPMAQSLLLRNHRPEKRGMAMGIWGMVIVVAPIFGPILGGWITDNLSWPWLFYINVPVGLIASATVWGLLRRRETARQKGPVGIPGLLPPFAGRRSL